MFDENYIFSFRYVIHNYQMYAYILFYAWFSSKFNSLMRKFIDLQIASCGA